MTQYLARCIFLFSILVTTNTHSITASRHSPANTLNYSIDSSQRFLLQALAERKTHLKCASTTNTACPVSDSGALLSLFYLYKALESTLSPKQKDQIVSLVNQERRTPRWLWGYKNLVIIDSDDTSFALQLLSMLNQPTSITDLLSFYKASSRGYSTFITNHDSQPELYVSENGNLGIHPEVNANIFHLFHRLQRDDKINYNLLLSFQSQQGYWYSYFYPSKYYATYLNMTLLCQATHYQDYVNKGLHFILNSQNSDGSWGENSNPYDSALALNTLLSCAPKEQFSIKKGINYLISVQQKDGHWSSTNPIWIFIYKDNPMTVWSAYDEEHVLATSLSLQALNAYKKIDIN